MRLYRPAADPPPWLYVYNTDEGHYSYNTHNKTKYGDWFVNEAKYALITPLFNVAQYWVAAPLIDHPNIVRYRAISVLSGILFCFALKFLFDAPFIQWTAVALGAISFMAVVHSRLGIPEMMLTLLMLATAVIAIEGQKRRSFGLYVVAGFAAVACGAIKPTGLLMVVTLMATPLVCRTMRGGRDMFFLGITTGILLAAITFYFVVVFPHSADWIKMIRAATSFGRRSIDSSLLGSLSSLYSFLLSPALQTMPILWPMALCWCIFVFLPRLKNRENDFAEALLFLWLCSGIVMLGLPSYQPARWQLLIFPPVMTAGFRFLQQEWRPRVIILALAFAVMVSVTSSVVHAKEILSFGPEVHPGDGVFSHIVTLAITGSVFLVALLVAKICNGGWRHGLLWGVFLIEISVQTMLHRSYTFPAYFRESQWDSCARALESLNHGQEPLFAGSMVQDFSLRANIRVLPKYYVLNESELDENSVRDFFARQQSLPDYFLLLDVEHRRWREKAPIFASDLEAIGRCRLLIGGLGLRDLYVYRFRSYNWLKSRAGGTSAFE